MKQKITIYNLGGLPTAPINDFNELQEDFKLHDEDKVQKLALIIMTRGFKYAFKAWKDNDGKLWIIDAHQRKKALLLLKKRGVDIPEIPYEPIHAEDKREAVEEIAAYNSEFAKKNPDTILFNKYAISVDDLSAFNIDFGLDIPSIDTKTDPKMLLSDELSKIDYDSEYDEPSDATTIFSQRGDIWLLGSHRLMCGDSCSPDDVALLMGNKRCDLIVTDPPYNVAYEGKTADAMTIDNDNMSDSDFDKFLFRAFKNMYVIAKEGASIYVFHSDTEGLTFRHNFKRSGFKLAQCCIWMKNTFVMGRQDYQWQHEPVLYGWKEGDAHKWYSDRSQTTIWQCDRPNRNGIHPTMKPIQLLSIPILNSSKEGDLVVDLFSGSGSTLITCEQYKRLCYSMELLPMYVDATVLRYIKAVGSEDVFVIRNGKRLHYSELTNDN